MSVKLVTYDISDDANRKSCREEIEKYDYINIGGSDYLIDTTKSVEAIKDQLKVYIDQDNGRDELFVCRVREGDWAAYMIGKRKREWIIENGS